jgi:hypothetical protein
MYTFFMNIVIYFAVNGPEFNLDVEDYLVGEWSQYVFPLVVFCLFEWNVLVVCCLVINIT